MDGQQSGSASDPSWIVYSTILAALVDQRHRKRAIYLSTSGNVRCHKCGLVQPLESAIIALPWALAHE